MTQSEANQKRAGKGREDPNDYPQLVTPAEGRGWGDVLGGFSISLPDLGLMKKIIPIVLFTLRLIICFSFTWHHIALHNFAYLYSFGWLWFALECLHELGVSFCQLLESGRFGCRFGYSELLQLMNCHLFFMCFPFHISLQLRLCLVLLRFIGLL